MCLPSYVAIKSNKCLHEYSIISYISVKKDLLIYHQAIAIATYLIVIFTIHVYMHAKSVAIVCQRDLDCNA